VLIHVHRQSQLPAAGNPAVANRWGEDQGLRAEAQRLLQARISAWSRGYNLHALIGHSVTWCAVQRR
jgi:hypothetical protein